MSLQLALAKAEKIAMDIITDHHTYISAARLVTPRTLCFERDVNAEERRHAYRCQTT